MTEQVDEKKFKQYEKRVDEIKEKWGYYYRKIKADEKKYGRMNHYCNIVFNLLGLDVFSIFLKKRDYENLENEIVSFEKNCSFLEIYFSLLDLYPEYKQLEIKKSKKTSPDGCFADIQNLGAKEYILESKKRLENQ